MSNAVNLTTLTPSYTPNTSHVAPKSDLTNKIVKLSGVFFETRCKLDKATATLGRVHSLKSAAFKWMILPPIGIALLFIATLGRIYFLTLEKQVDQQKKELNDALVQGLAESLSNKGSLRDAMDAALEIIEATRTTNQGDLVVGSVLATLRQEAQKHYSSHPEAWKAEEYSAGFPEAERKEFLKLSFAEALLAVLGQFRQKVMAAQ